MPKGHNHGRDQPLTHIEVDHEVDMHHHVGNEEDAKILLCLEEAPVRLVGGIELKSHSGQVRLDDSTRVTEL